MSSLMSLAGPRTQWSPGICRSNLFKVATGQTQIHWQMSARVLNDVFSVLTPPPALTPEEYDGWEYRWKFFVFRPACNLSQLCRMTESKSLSQQCWRLRAIFSLAFCSTACLHFGDRPQIPRKRRIGALLQKFSHRLLLLMFLSFIQAGKIPSNIRATIL